MGFIDLEKFQPRCYHQIDRVLEHNLKNYSFLAQNWLALENEAGARIAQEQIETMLSRLKVRVREKSEDYSRIVLEIYENQSEELAR